MRPEASSRELQAIESEYNLSRGNDATRCTQLVGEIAQPVIDPGAMTRFTSNKVDLLAPFNPVKSNYITTDSVSRPHPSHPSTQLEQYQPALTSLHRPPPPKK